MPSIHRNTVEHRPKSKQRFPFIEMSGRWTRPCGRGRRSSIEKGRWPFTHRRIGSRRTRRPISIGKPIDIDWLFIATSSSTDRGAISNLPRVNDGVRLAKKKLTPLKMSRTSASLPLEPLGSNFFLVPLIFPSFPYFGPLIFFIFRWLIRAASFVVIVVPLLAAFLAPYFITFLFFFIREGAEEEEEEVKGGGGGFALLLFYLSLFCWFFLSFTLVSILLLRAPFSVAFSSFLLAALVTGPRLFFIGFDFLFIFRWLLGFSWRISQHLDAAHHGLANSDLTGIKQLGETRRRGQMIGYALVTHGKAPFGFMAPWLAALPIFL